MRATMVLWTWPALPSLRLRFELLLDARWRRPGLRRMIFPVAVILSRLAADFFVLRRAIDFGMGARKVAGGRRPASSFSETPNCGSIARKSLQAGFEFLEDLRVRRCQLAVRLQQCQKFSAAFERGARFADRGCL